MSSRIYIAYLVVPKDLRHGHEVIHIWAQSPFFRTLTMLSHLNAYFRLKCSLNRRTEHNYIENMYEKVSEDC